MQLPSLVNAEMQLACARSLGRMLHRSNSTIAIIQYVTIPGGPPLINITGDNSFAIDRKMRRARGIATVRVLVMAEGREEGGRRFEKGGWRGGAQTGGSQFVR